MTRCRQADFGERSGDRSCSPHALEVAQRVRTDAGVAVSGTVYLCRPEEFAERLSPTGLLRVARLRRWRLLYLRFGGTPDRTVERVAGPVAVMAKP